MSTQSDRAPAKSATTLLAAPPPPHPPAPAPAAPAAPAAASLTLALPTSPKGASNSSPQNARFPNVTEAQRKTNKYAALVPGQTIVEIPAYTLECGETLHRFPVAYKTWGRLNAAADNVLLICHALTGSLDVLDWWGPLLGTDKTFDPLRFYIVCINFLGSPYGSCLPVTVDPMGRPYGPTFPLVTVKDDIGIQKMILDSLGVRSIACVIGGSMGGMLALEYLATYPDLYVRTVVALATLARALAWCILWNETQRQCIFSDPNYDDGYYYENPDGPAPTLGLSAARMAALLTYRLSNSFETRFGRNAPQDTVRLPTTKDEENWLLHNQGARSSRRLPAAAPPITATTEATSTPQTYFTAQLYLRYQGTKFIKRFDANCYILITRKLDTHDITRGRIEPARDGEDPLPAFLSTLTKPHLVVGIRSDGLFTYLEQQLLAQHIPNAVLKTLDSAEGHDAFLLEFETIDAYCRDFLHRHLPSFYATTDVFSDWANYVESTDNGGNLVFGEAEQNITNW